MKKQKQVWISERLHTQLKRECKNTRVPRVNLGDRVEELIRKGLRLEALTASAEQSEA